MTSSMTVLLLLIICSARGSCLIDVSTVPDNLYIKYIQLIEKETGIPAMNIIISSFPHSHSPVRLPANDAKPDDPVCVALFAANFEKSIVEAVRQAKGNLFQPAAGSVQGRHIVSQCQPRCY
ncbi:MAG: hypothetical protein MZV63_32910 [Marinilabiliales bacterium]|nr:hypothetical protein [Marinilabiliales bacterium]